MDMNVLELKRKLSLRKRKYETGLLKLIELFNIDDKEYKKDFAYLSEKMIELGIKDNNIKKEMNEVDIEFGREYLVPSIFDPRLLTTIPMAVAKAAMESGAARKEITDWDEYKFQLKSRV